MKVIYPYNEHLPNKKAHDYFIFHSSYHLAKQGADLTLLCGHRSKAENELHHHYHTLAHPHFHIKPLPLIRKSFGFSYNLPFFFLCQREIEKNSPDLVILSVRKQGLYHLKRKRAKTRYLYEVHELCYYPGDPVTAAVSQERTMLSLTDHIVVTTEALKEILLKPPYALKVPISVIPLASASAALPCSLKEEALHLFYVGALYLQQGIDLLLEALANTTEVSLTLIGGKEAEILFYQEKCKALGIDKRVHFLGFRSPRELASLVAKATAFVTPFLAVGRMPYVAHTKIHEYAAWQRAIIAPNLPVVKEHIPYAQFFTPGDLLSLTAAIKALQNPSHLMKKEEEAKSFYRRPFGWEERALSYLAI